MRTPALEVVGLRKTYRRDGRALEVLDLARLSVADGEFVTVVGPSGCGKSTLLHVLGGFIPGDAGEIRVHGRAVVGPGPDRGMVFREFSLFPWRTVSGNVGWGLEVRGARPGRARRGRGSLSRPDRARSFAITCRPSSPAA
jgi:NitT/TauT family transport system ATP-binding protein